MEAKSRAKRRATIGLTFAKQTNGLQLNARIVAALAAIKEERGDKRRRVK